MQAADVFLALEVKRVGPRSVSTDQVLGVEKLDTVLIFTIVGTNSRTASSSSTMARAAWAHQTVEPDQPRPVAHSEPTSKSPSCGAAMGKSSASGTTPLCGCRRQGQHQATMGVAVQLQEVEWLGCMVLLHLPGR